MGSELCSTSLSALSSPQVPTLYFTHVISAYPHSDCFHNCRQRTQHVTSKELCYQNSSSCLIPEPRFVTTAIRNHLCSSHFSYIKPQSKSYFLYENSILFFWPGMALDWVCTKATTCHVRHHWSFIPWAPLTGKLI